MASYSSTGLQVFAIEDVTRNILFYLDLSSFDAILHVFQTTPVLHGYLHDSLLWTDLSILHFKSQRDLELRFMALSVQDRVWNWSSRDRTCVELQEFLQSKDEPTQFDSVVKILKGNIRYIKDIDGQRFDGIAFPTTSCLATPFDRTAQRVFRQTGHSLKEYLSDHSFRGHRRIGSVVVTPAFDAGVRKLIHCVQPVVPIRNCFGDPITIPNLFEELATTYENAMTAILQEELICVAMASITTEFDGVPYDEGPQVALRTFQKFLRDNHWAAKLAIVCNNDYMLKIFTKKKQDILERFNEAVNLPILPQYTEY